MKIVHLGKYYPPEWGGIESVTQAAALGAAAQGHAVEVHCFTKQALTSDVESARAVRVQRYPVRKMIGPQPLSASYFKGALRAAAQAGIVHLHAPNLLASLISCLMGARPALVVHWHSDVINQRWKGWFVRPLEWAMLMRADAIVATSQAYIDGSALLRRFRKKTVAVPLGVEPVRDDPTGAAAHLTSTLQQFIGNRPLILSVGRLTGYKGFDVLIDAARHIDPAFAIVIVGRGDLLEPLQQQIVERGLQGRVMLTNDVEYDELQLLYRRASLFCMASVDRAEAFGVVLLEAMSHRLPIVATQIRGSAVPWLNQHGITGLNVPVRDPQALAAACMQLMQDDLLRKRYGGAAHKRFVDNFTQQQFIDGMLRVYDRRIAAIEEEDYEGNDAPQLWARSSSA